MAKRSGKANVVGAHALAHRLAELIGPELVNFTREAYGTEGGDVAAAIRQELRDQAREVFVEWASMEMRLACGLAARVSDLSSEDEDE